jgi:integrase
VGAYLAAAGLGYALPTLRRRVAAIARAHHIAGFPLDTKHPSIRETLRGIGRTHGEPARKSAALTTDDIKKLAEVCADDLAGLRDRALILLCFAGALRRSELVGIDVEHIHKTESGIRLLIPHSKTDATGEGAEIGIVSGSNPETCPVRGLRAWLHAAGIGDGPVFRRVTRHATVGSKRLSPEAVWRVLKSRAEMAGLKGTMLEPISPHGMRAGFVTTAYRNGVADEEIMGHTRHRSLSTMRGYVRRAKLGKASPSGKVGL